MKTYKIILSCILCITALSLQAQNVLPDARIYVNPGHGGWGANDRPMATINHAVLDSLGFFETNTNLWKAQALQEELEKNGAYVRMSRTINGIYTAGSPSPNSKYEETLEGTEIDGVKQIITLSVICTDVETNNMDYFLSIHSNAATEGAATNYPLLLYRGTDAAVGNLLVDAKNMATVAWPYINDNPVTYHSHYTTTSNIRGDVTFMGGQSTTTPVEGGPSYTGYYGVLRHGCDGFLSEGCFHTYQPERHRLLNKDYCRQEGMRYSRGIRAWFGDNTETKGCIMGSVKDKSRSVVHSLYQYKIGSNDEYYPLNGATVILQNSSGEEIDRYTVDNEYNGIFVFTDLTPGTYKLVFNASDFDEETKEIEVKANETAFFLQVFGEEQPINTDCIDFKDPEQDGDIAAASSYEFEQVGELKTIDALEDLTVRRAILRDGKYYVLAVDEQKDPKLLVIDPETGELIKEMSTEGISTTGYNGKSHAYNLSDIGFTADGVLIGTNSTVVGRLNNAYQTGDFYVYKWQETEAIALEDATPQVLIRIETNVSATSIMEFGGNNSNFVGNTIAVSGCSDDFKLFFHSHPGNLWTASPTDGNLENFNILHIGWLVKDGTLTGYQRNDTKYYIEDDDGENLRMNLSPLGNDRYVMEGSRMLPTETQFNWSSNVQTYNPAFTGDLPVGSTGATYFKYAGKSFMSAPVCEKQDDDTYSYKVKLFDITDGLNHAEEIGETEAVITGEPAMSYMTSPVMVQNADMEVYLLVGNKSVKYRTVREEVAVSRIFAYNLSSTDNGSGYDISFELNEDALSVELILTDSEGDKDPIIIPLGSLAKGTQQTTVSEDDIPEDGKYYWSIRAKAANVTQFFKMSGDNENYNYFAPKSAAADKSPESEYFGRVYIANSADGTKDGRETAKGIYVLDPLGDDVTGQGDAAYAGDEAWSGTAGQNFRKAAVASDGRIFIADASVGNSGIYIMDPSTFEMAQLFTPTRDADGKFYSGSTYIGGRTTAVGAVGSGSETKLYANVFDPDNTITWRRWSNSYNIGEASTWSDAPNSSVASGSYVGNENNSIVPVTDGFWAGQYRGAGSNSVGNPCMYFFSTQRNAVTFNSAEMSDGLGGTFALTQPSQNGGLAVYEKEGLIALSYDGGVQVFQYELGSNGVPTVNMKFFNDLGVSGVSYDDFEFDYAGNLYAVSASGSLVSVWAMPTSDNTCVTPARSSLLLVKAGNVGFYHPVVKQPIQVMRTPSGIEIRLVETSTIELYSVNGQLIDKTIASGSYSRSLERGIYIVRVNGEVVKFVK